MKPMIFAIIALSTAAPAVAASPVCMAAPEMEAALTDWYGETPVGDPVGNTQHMWASAATGSWTLVKYLADGNACVVAQGDTWAPGRSDELIVAALDQ